MAVENGGACPLASLRFPDRDAWTLLRRSRSRVRIGEIDLKWIQPPPDDCLRMAATLRRKNGPAPLRNRIRRQLRELIRLERGQIQPAWLWWSFPPARIKTPTKELRQQARDCLVKAGLLPS